MKGEQKVIDILNQALADELTAINQYIVHSEMCENWGYSVLHNKIEKRAIDEMKHAESLIARILFLLMPGFVHIADTSRWCCNNA